MEDSLGYTFQTLKMQKCQPLSVKTVIIPKGQARFGCDIVRFTADYAASDLYGMCTGCYPPCHSNLEGIIVIDDDDSTFYPSDRSSMQVDARRKVDLRKATSGVCQQGDPLVMKVTSPLETCAWIPEPAAQRRYPEV